MKRFFYSWVIYLFQVVYWLSLGSSLFLIMSKQDKFNQHSLKQSHSHFVQILKMLQNKIIFLFSQLLENIFYMFTKSTESYFVDLTTPDLDIQKTPHSFMTRTKKSFYKRQCDSKVRFFFISGPNHSLICRS